MAIKIKFKRSDLNTPVSLDFGEPAFTEIDGKVKLYVGDSSNNPKEIAGDSFAKLDSPALIGEPTAPTATAGDNSQKIATTEYVETAVTNATTGLFDDRGAYDASSNLYPEPPVPGLGGSGPSGTILKGDLWTFSVGGTFNGKTYDIGATVRSLVNNPGQVHANWSFGEQGIGYVPENQANKETSSLDNSSTKYPNNNVVKTALDNQKSVIEVLTNKTINGDNNSLSNISNASLKDAPSISAINFYIDKYEGLATNSGKLNYKFKASPRDAINNAKFGSSIFINAYQYDEDCKIFSSTIITGDTTSGSNVIANSVTTYLAVGMKVSGTGIPANSTITEVTNTTSFKISSNATSSNSGLTLTITIPSSNSRDNLYIQGSGSTGSYPTIINGDITISGVVTRSRFRDIQIGTTAGKGKLTIDGTEGRDYFDNVYFNNGITALNGFKRWHDFNNCSGAGVISLGETGTPAAGTEFLFNGGDWNDITDLRIGHQNITVKFLNCRRLPQKITWIKGNLSFEGNNILESGSNTTFIDGTCNSGQGSLYIGNGFNFKRKSGVNGAIKSLGTAPITIGSGVRDTANDVFSGSVSYLQLTNDLNTSISPVNYTSSDSKLNNLLSGIDNKFGDIETSVEDQLNNLLVDGGQF